MKHAFMRDRALLILTLKQPSKKSKQLTSSLPELDPSPNFIADHALLFR